MLYLSLSIGLLVRSVINRWPKWARKLLLLENAILSYHAKKWFINRQNVFYVSMCTGVRVDRLEWLF